MYPHLAPVWSRQWFSREQLQELQKVNAILQVRVDVLYHNVHLQRQNAPHRNLVPVTLALGWQILIFLTQSQEHLGAEVTRSALWDLVSPLFVWRPATRFTGITHWMRAGWQGCTVRFSTFYAVQQLQYFVLLLLDYHLFCSAKSMMSSSPLFSQWPAPLPEFLPQCQARLAASSWVSPEDHLVCFAHSVMGFYASEMDYWENACLGASLGGGDILPSYSYN